jgi:phytoene synthase
VPIAHLESVIDGVEMDLEPRHYQTFDQLEQYCHRVASAVGLACLRIWGCRAPEAEEPARRCGVAFQLTNILRDLKEDADRGRVYLPREDLDRFGYSAEELRAGVRDERFRELMRFEVARAEKLYEEGNTLERWLSSDGRRIFGSMIAVYRALLEEIRRLETDVLTTRARLSSWRKLRIAGRWLLLGGASVEPVGVSAR